MTAALRRTPLHVLARLTLPAALLACGAASAFATQSWTRVRQPLGGSVKGLVVSPHDSDLLLAGLWKGLYRTENGGTQWEGPLLDDIVYSFDWHPTDPNIVLAGSVPGAWRSTDGGMTWTAASFQNGNPDWVPSVCFDPTQNGVAYALTSNFSTYRAVLYVSADSGANWTRLPRPPSDGYRELHIDASGDLIVSGGDGILRSTDGGLNYDRVHVHGVYDIEPDRSNPSVYWAGAFGTMLTSLDGGASWQESPAPPGAGNPETVLSLPGQPGRLIVNSGGNLWSTHDGGNHWREIVHLPNTVSIQSLATSPTSSGPLWLGSSNGSGVWRSTDDGATWHCSSSGMHPIIDQLVTDFTDPSPGYAVSTEGGLFVTDNGGLSWEAVLDIPGNGVRVGEAAGVNSNTPQLLITDTSSSNSRLLLHKIGSGQWQESSPPVATSWPAIGIGDGRIFAGNRGHNIATSTDGGQSWTVGTGGGSHDKIVVDPRSSNRAHVTGSDGHYRTIDGGQSWTQVGAPPPRLVELAVDPRNSRKLFAVGNAAFGAAGFYKSTDGGTTWVQTAAGLPASTSFHHLLIDPRRPRRILIGSASLPWIWRSEDGGRSFARLPSPGPDFVTIDLESAPGDPDTIWAVDDEGRIWSFQL